MQKNQNKQIIKKQIQINYMKEKMKNSKGKPNKTYNFQIKRKK